MNNKLNIHKLRALCAQNAFRYYEKQIAEKGDSFRETMEKEFTAYFDMYIHDSQQLNTIMMKLQKIKGILKVERVEQRNWR